MSAAEATEATEPTEPTEPEVNASLPDLVLKTTPPRISRHMLARAKLSLDSAPMLRDKSIVQVVAPAGFGKTSLLAQWRRESLSRSHLVAWLTLDSGDDAFRFAEGLAVAMRIASGRPVFGRSVSQLIRQNVGGLAGLTAWLAEIVNLGSETLLILDEVQALPAATRDQSLLYLLVNAPANLKIILSSRVVLPLPLSELLARGRHTTIGVDLLRFSLNETMRVLAASLGKRVDEAMAVRLHEKSAGWPLGLQLAISYLEKQEDITTALDNVSAATGNIERYFMECLVTALSTEQLNLLHTLSLLEHFNDDLVRHVTAQLDSPVMLAELASTTPIITQGQDSDWMRLHPMAQEFFAQKGKERDQGEAKLQHERAATWLCQHQMIEDAVRHALAAGRSQWAYELIGEGLYHVMVHGHQLHVLHWLDELPSDALERQPRVLLGAAWALAESEHHHRAESLVAQLLANPNLNANERLEAMVIRGTAAHFADRIDECAAIYEQCRYDESLQSNFLKALTANAHGTVALYRGEPQQCRRQLRLVRPLIHHYMAALGGYCDWLYGFSYLWEGQVVKALDALQPSLQQYEQRLGRRAAVTVMLASACALAAWESGHSELAETVLLDRLDVLEQISTPEGIIMGYQVAVRIAAQKGQKRRELDLLENLYALGESRGVMRYCFASLYEQIRRCAEDGLCDSCQAQYRRFASLLATCSEAGTGILAPFIRIRHHLAQAYTALAAHRWGDLQQAVEPVVGWALDYQRGREAVEAKMLLALAYHKNGLDGRTLIHEAMELAELYGLKRTPADIFPQWFDGLCGKSSEPAQRMAAPTATAPPRPLVSGRHSGLLTVKEQEILQLLQRNMSNKQIALALGVSDETIKWHLKNLFSKLNAVSRRHVVDRARMLGVIAD